MAITFDSVGFGNSVGATITYQVTVGNNANRLLVVGVGMKHSILGETVIPNSVTYDGVAMTLIDSNLYDGTVGPYAIISLWYLLAPNIVTANVVVTFSTAPNSLGSSGCVSVHGAHQQGPDVTAKAIGTSKIPTVPITTLAANAWLFDTTHIGSSQDFIPGADQTQRYEGGTVGQRIAGSTEPGGAAGPHTMSWSFFSSSLWGIIATSFIELITWTPVTDTFDAKVINSFDASGIDTDIYGMTFDGRNLWIIGNSDSVLHQVDRLGNIILEIDLSSIAASITAITFYNNSFWIFDETNGYLVHISLGGSVLQTIDVSGITADCKGLDFDGLFFWLSGSVGQNIYQINLDGKNVSNILTTYGKTHGVCFDGRNLVCMDNTKRTLEIYNKLGTQIGEFDFDPIDNSPRAICFDGTYYWISGNENDKIYQVRII